MATRLELHDEFIDVLGTRDELESRAYFQPPPSKRMSYPCIRYSRSVNDIKRANNKVYMNTNKYEGVVIDPDPDSDIPNKLLERFPMFTLEKPYVADNLNHFPFTIYY